MKNFEKIMSNMTPESMAELGVKLISVNNRDLYYMTSTGQLFYTADYQSALQHELRWLMTDPDPVTNPDPNKGNMSETNKMLTEEIEEESSN